MYLLFNFLVASVRDALARRRQKSEKREGRPRPGDLFPPSQRYHLLHESFPHFASLGMCDFEAFTTYPPPATCYSERAMFPSFGSSVLSEAYP